MRFRRVNLLTRERIAAYGTFGGGRPQHRGIVFPGAYRHHSALVAAFGNRGAGGSAAAADGSPLSASAPDGQGSWFGQAAARGTSGGPFFSIVDFSMSQPLGGRSQRQPASGASGAGAAQSNAVLVDRRDGASQRSETVHFAAGQWLGSGGGLAVARAGRGCGRV